MCARGRRRRRRQPGDPRRSPRGCEASPDAIDHATACTLHRQRRDDRMGRRGAPRARDDGYDGCPAPRALATRFQCDGAERLRQYPRGILAMTAFQSVAVIGAGAWGTALATVAARAGRSVTLWARNADHAAQIASTRDNPRLSGVRLEPEIGVQSELALAARADVLLLATPEQHLASAGTL